MWHMYQAQRLSRSEFVPVRTLNYHVRIWGKPVPGATPLVLLHGWMDVAASFQFVVDALAAEHFIIAPDWRGFGLTDSGGVDCFWYQDYLADLDALLKDKAKLTAVLTTTPATCRSTWSATAWVPMWQCCMPACARSGCAA